MTRSMTSSTRAPTRDRKAQLLTQAAPARVSGIADAVIIKDEGIAFVCARNGSVPGSRDHGMGLYFHDCRYLSRLELRIAGVPPESLAASSADGFRSLFQLTNPEIESDGATIGRQEIGIRWRHVIDAGDVALRDELVIQNYHTQPHTITLSLSIDADFADIFNIRGLSDSRPGTRHPVRWDGGGLVFAYEGGDDRRRYLQVSFSQSPSSHEGKEVTFRVSLEPQQITRLVVSFAIVEVDGDQEPPMIQSGEQAVAAAEDAFGRSIAEWLKGFTSVTSSSSRLNRVVDRSLRDLRALRMTLDGRQFFAAGVPWFMTLFGRDSVLCSLQTLAYRREIAEDTLRLLARYQGSEDNSWRDEQPGKILHEMRVGELARMGRIPHTPYYGTVDATPLFLILLDEQSRWSGSLALFNELRDHVERAMEWLRVYGDSDGDGYIDYRSDANANGRLVNQGWKDSGDAIVDANGDIVEPPVALVELQGYAYAARNAVARLLEQSGETERAAELRREAETLRSRFNRDFWSKNIDFLALALHGDTHKAAEVVASNAGHALWSGIVDERYAERVVRRLLAEDMNSGWGIRTLSTQERAYNPVGYHLGTVWPHDNALIVAGFRRYGYDDEACQLFA
ncbi:MAG TPA: glycogen debranching N-terminal domain-containing protein, partial [Gemmatimonadaceae bacterium]